MTPDDQPNDDAQHSGPERFAALLDGAEIPPRPPTAPEPPLSAADLERLYAALVENTGEGRTVVTADGRIIYRSAANTRMTGWSDAEAGSANVFELIHPDDLPEMASRFAKILVDPDSPQRMDYRFRGPDGTYRELEAWAYNRLDDPDIGGVVITTRDAATVAALRNEAASARGRLAAISEAIDDVLMEFSYGPDGALDIRYVSNLDRVANWVTTPSGEMIDPRFDLANPLSWRDAVDNERSSMPLDQFQQRLRSGEDFDVELCIGTGDPGELWVWLRSVSEIEPDGTTVVRAIASNITERKHVARGLAERRRQLRALIDHMNAAIFVVDESGDLSVINTAACRLVGLSSEADEYVGRPAVWFNEQVAALADDPDEVAAFLQELASRRERAVGIPLELSGDRAMEIIYILVACSENERGRLWVLRDVTEARRAALELADAHQAALRSARVKAEFLAMMSHEIRTPLNGVIGMLELIDDGTLETEKARMAKLVRQSSHALLATIEDILDYSRIEAGRLQTEEAPFDLRALLEESAGLLEPVAQQRNLELSVSFESGVGDAYRGDAGKLRQVVLNLLGNAVRFTDEGSVRLAAAVGDDGMVRISVADTGVGIEPDALPELFEPFVQGDAGPARSAGGTGLGLAITRRLVEMLGGVIEVTSAPGEGATFVVSIPLEPADPDSLGEREPLPAELRRRFVTTAAGDDFDHGTAEAEAEERSRRVLVVEDTPTNAHLALLQLERVGAVGEWARSGEEALERLAGEEFDLVLMDCNMPGMDGYETTRRIRQLPGDTGAHVPVVAMTASVVEGERRRCLDAGMNEYLTKPVRLDALRQTVESWAGLDIAAQSIDRGALADLVDDIGDESVVSSAISTYLAEMPGRVDAIRRAADRADSAGMVKAAHALRSASAAFGAGRLRDLCAELEALAGSLPRESMMERATAIEVEVAAVTQSLRNYLGVDSDRARHSPSR